MNRISTLLVVVFLCGALPVCADDTNDLKVMSFNIRYGKAKDGDNHWSKRHQLVVKTIRNYEPDLLGTQETLKFQGEYLQENLSHMTYVGWSRDSSENGEQCGILFRTSRFQLNDSGQFWLSDTPETKFSKSWDSSLPRVATWVNLTDNSSGRKLLFVNTHFDHRGSQARLESAKLIRKFIESQPADLPVVLTGDFNCAESSAPYQALLGSNRIVDTFRTIKPTATKSEGTFNGFAGKQTGPRIDWIAASKDWTVKAAAIDRFSQNNQFPSDHFPVTASLSLK